MARWHRLLAATPRHGQLIPWAKLLESLLCLRWLYLESGGKLGVSLTQISAPCFGSEGVGYAANIFPGNRAGHAASPSAGEARSDAPSAGSAVRPALDPEGECLGAHEEEEAGGMLRDGEGGVDGTALWKEGAQVAGIEVPVANGAWCPRLSAQLTRTIASKY
ncbi:hypothetical protein Anapl_16987 [Anas platyrhynchos]|uniref:Uncharacterized protein n=1 Tax=Anas platyrhynchos TaxID=8839 RepID=R0L6Q6_ANAPL|nr:hypothetical protein Anapl_16987 [Anas platyrhynchos]